MLLWLRHRNDGRRLFGTHGQVYKITEKNALDAIYEKLKAMEKTGELAKRKRSN